MAVYSVGRRRIILALLLTSALLLTLDLRGNPVLDRLRDGAAWAIAPVESAVDVVARPLERAWNGITGYDELERENEALQDQVDRLIGSQASAEAAVLEYQELRALFNLPSLAGIETEVAQVVGASANNLDQVVEINKGRSSGVAVGMPVVNQAGLIGKVTSVTDVSARVMLITDARYSVAAKIVGAPADDAPAPEDTTPSGLTEEEVEAEAAAATSTTTTTVPGDTSSTTTTLPDPDDITPDTTLPGTSPGDAGDLSDLAGLDPDELSDLAGLDPDELSDLAAPDGDEDGDTGDTGDTGGTGDGSVDDDLLFDDTSTTTTTTEPFQVQKEFGALEGRGRDLLPQVRFLQDTPSLAVLSVGDLVFTAGGSESLAPGDIPIGRVVNRADRPGSGGPLLDVEPHADLTKLNFVRVVLYRPLSEIEQ